MGSYVNEEEDHIKEPKDGLVRYDREAIHEIRKEFNLDKKENREEAIRIVTEWIKQQDHFVKKTFSKGYIERSIILCKGSLERTKQQLDRMCTFRTLMPKYFQITDIYNSDLMKCFEKAYICFVPQLTNEYYRVFIVKLKPQVVLTTYHYTILYKFLILTGEYLKDNDFCRGFILIADFYDTSASELMYKINFPELQQFLPILTKGYGLKMKGIYMVTKSKIVENFLYMVKQLFSSKIAGRIQAINSRKELHNIVNGDILPEEYGGPEKSIELLTRDLLASFSAESMKELFADMNKAVTDESKRQIYEFNDKYMGMPGTFRTLSLD